MARLFVTALLATLFPLQARADFSLVVLPDTQRYSQRFPDIFAAQTQWIVGNVESENIVFVLHEGDLVEHVSSVGQWENADAAMSILDGVVPYAITIGNHDMGSVDNANDRDTTMFNTYFPVSRYEHEPWYGGHMGEDNDNYYCFFSADGLDFMVVSLEFGPDDETLAWASQVVASHPERKVIVLTHCYMYHNDTRVAAGHSLNPHIYGINATGVNDGEEIWEKLVKNHANIFLVLSGHILGDGRGRLTSTGINGNVVHQVLANYQSMTEGGGGWLRIMRFGPSEDFISVTTYSPWLDEYTTDDQNEFELRCGVKSVDNSGACAPGDNGEDAPPDSDDRATQERPADGDRIGHGGPCGVGVFSAILLLCPVLGWLKFQRARAVPRAAQTTTP